MKEHLRESITVYNCQHLDELSAEKYNPLKLQESSASIKQIIKLAESLKDYPDQQLLENIIKNLKEKGSPSEKKLWKLPIARYDNLNGNQRIYPKKLYENIMNDQRDLWEGIPGLADHPEEDNDRGSFKNSAVVWLDMIVGDNGLVFGIGKFVGEYGSLAEEIIEAGGKVGFSMSGFGEVDKNTGIVNPESYVIERIADVVIGPSQSVYGTIDCAHSPDNFMNDVHQGAIIDYNKQSVRESKSQIVNRRVKEMADQNTLKVNAAQPVQNQQAGQVQTQVPNNGVNNVNNNSGQAVQPATGQQPANQNQQQQESVKMSQKGLTKIEEKAFRKYVEAFINDVGKMDNPIRRLEECSDILSCFEEGNCPDLKAKIEESLKAEKERLEKVVETTVKMEKDFGLEAGAIREKMEARLAEGLYLKDQVVDYEQLVEGLVERNKTLLKENNELKKVVLIRTKLSKESLKEKNKEIVSDAQKIDNLKEEIYRLNDRNSRLMERISKFAISNRSFDKENGKLDTDLKKAVSLLRESRDYIAGRDNEIKQLHERINALNESVEDKEKQLSALKEQYEAGKIRFDKLTESFNNYKQEVADTYNPVAHLIPNSTERVGKYLNLRENKGADVETYWQRLSEQYGDNIKPYEEQIRNSKTLQEATNKFLKYRDKIDVDFSVGGESPENYNFRNQTERKKITEQLGQIVPDKENWDVDQINNDFMAKQKALGQL